MLENFLTKSKEIFSQKMKSHCPGFESILQNLTWCFYKKFQRMFGKSLNALKQNLRKPERRNLQHIISLKAYLQKKLSAKL